LRKARNILDESDGDQVAALNEVLERCEKHLKSLALYCVDGKSAAPHSVICHGDFWNNNILYRHEVNIFTYVYNFAISRNLGQIIEALSKRLIFS